MHILLDALAGLHAAHEASDVEGNPLNIVHRDFSCRPTKLTGWCSIAARMCGLLACSLGRSSRVARRGHARPREP
jgi:hypothetical protein